MEKDKNGMNLSVIIPVYNEEGALVKVVEKALADAKKYARKHELILVDDASTDESAAVVDLLADKYRNISVVHHKQNMGLGKALLTGIEVAKYEIITYIPADGQAHISDQEKLLDKIYSSDLVLGYRPTRSDYTFFRMLLSYGFLFLLWITYGLRYRDVNWVHVYRKEIFDKIKIKSESPFFLAELVIKARRQGFRIREAKSIYRPRESGDTKVAKLNVVVKVLIDMFRLKLGIY